MRNLSRPSAMVAVLALVVSACSSATATPAPTAAPTTVASVASLAAASPTAATGGKITVAYNFTPKSSWAMETDDANTLSMMGVTETLTKVGFDGNIQPNLATSWTRTDDLTWTFTLKDGVKFQDGTALDATVAAADLARLLTVTTPPKGFPTKLIASVTASGTNQVVVKTKVPSALVPYNVASANTGILAAAGVKDGKVNPIGTGTGPFVITAINGTSDVTLKANATYWGAKPKISDVSFKFIPDGATRATMVQTGEATIATSLPPATLPTLKSVSSVQVVTASTPRITALYLNNKKAPFTNVLVRQAIQAAIDVKAIANDVVDGAGVPAVGPFDPKAPYTATGATPVSLDVTKAKNLITQSGFDPTKTTLNLWTYVERSELKDVAVAIMGMLQTAGFSVNLRIANYAAEEPDLLAGNFDMLVLSRNYLLDVADPASWLASDYGCSGTYNISHFCDATFDSNVQKAIALSDPAARYAVYQAASKQLQEQAVDVFLYETAQNDAVSTKLKGYAIHPLTIYLLTPDLSL
jgi:peptide/nickel transport system substrate-binding protein